MNILTAEFITSAVSAEGLTRARAPRLALVGRSNVGKSSLINGLVRRRLARTSRAPGKTRLLNVYRVSLAQAANCPGTIDLVDLPGYGYARGGRATARLFSELTEAYFDTVSAASLRVPWREDAPPRVLLLVDARHPGLASDQAAHAWLAERGCHVAVVGTKIDAVSRAARDRARQTIEDTLGTTVCLASARTGEGLSDLWKLIITLTTTRR